MKKRILSMLLVLVMVIGMIPFSALSASAADTEDIRLFGGKETSKVETTDYGTWYEDDNGHIVLKELDDTTLYWIDRVNLTSAYQNPNTWSEPKLTADFPTGSQPPSLSYYYTNNFVSNLEFVFFEGSDFYRTKSDGAYQCLFPSSYYETSGIIGVRTSDSYRAKIYQSVRLYDTGNQNYYVPDDSAYPVGSYVVEYQLKGGKMPNITFDSGERMKVTLDGAILGESDVQYIPNTYYLVEKDWDSVSSWYHFDSAYRYNANESEEYQQNAKENSSPNTLYHQLYAYGEKFYVYDVKPEIKSVLVNGENVADGATVTVNSKNVTIKTTYDSELSQALQDYGCSVKQLSAYYLNGEKINVAALTPVSNGDGTSTKTYSRTMNGGDVLTVESWLEVTWPDGSKDVVDERTVTVMNVDADFESISPVPTSTELTNKYTDLGTMDLGSADTNIEFKAFPKKLSAASIEDGWTTGRSISVTRDGVEIYNKTYADNELFGWNLKDNIDEGGTYVITLRVFAQKGEQIVEKIHKFRVFVKGSTIKTIALEGVGTPVIGKSPSTINTVKSNTDGVVVNRVIWNYWTSEMGGNWFVMPSGSKFEAGKRYAVEIELQTADGYSFTANKSDMTVYINGEKAGKSVNYDSNKFSAELEFEAITTPEFTTQPTGGNVAYGEKMTVNWATNFTPCKIVVGEYNSLNQVVNQVEYSNTTTSVELPANEYGYVVIAYYNDANAKYSNKITITETAPAFTLQPADCVSLGGAYAEATWATNFTPVKLALVKINRDPNGRPFYTFEELDANATSCTVEPGFDEYCIYAYYNDTEYVCSEYFIVTEEEDTGALIGDVNKDGLVNAKDALLLRKSIAAGNASSLDLKVADVNGDGVINAKDVVKLRRIVTGGYN